MINTALGPARLRHTKVACHIHVSLVLALTATRRSGILSYFISQFPNSQSPLVKQGLLGPELMTRPGTTVDTAGAKSDGEARPLGIADTSVAKSASEVGEAPPLGFQRTGP